MSRAMQPSSYFVALLSGFVLLAGSLRPDSPSEPGPAGEVRFTEHLVQDGYGYAFGLAVADLDNDGKPDFTSADTTNNVLYWYSNDGKGKFTRHIIRDKEMGWLERHAIGDIDGDGKPDVVIVKNLHSELVWLQNPGKPRNSKSWKLRHIAKNFPRAYDVVLADLAGTGRLDVAASAWQGHQLAWFENPGKHDGGKEWIRHVLDKNLTESRTIRAADFNGDGRLDLLATGSAAGLVVWYENPGKPLNQPWKKHIIDDKCVRPIHGHPVDLDGDGDMDVVMALGMAGPAGLQGTHQVAWYENVGKPGKGTVWKKHVIGELRGAFEAVAADLNGDGKLDVVATAYGPPGRLVWFENPGDPRQTPWKMHIIKDNWTAANQVIVADLDGDGVPDILASAERGSNEVRWWRNERKK
jgi:antibiotic biosynthesis monooxygenase (ABM) superfamily enzyme